MTKTGSAATIPLHPYLVKELQRAFVERTTTNVFDSLPNRVTVIDDLTAASIPIVDEHGRRAGYHGLRYMFATLLDETGASHGTRRALMRHSTGDMTDGYTVARQSEMYEAVKRLPAPSTDILLHDVKNRSETGSKKVTRGEHRRDLDRL